MVSSSSSLGVTWQRGRKSGSNSQLHHCNKFSVLVKPLQQCGLWCFSHAQWLSYTRCQWSPSPSWFHDHIAFSKRWSWELPCPRAFSSEHLLPLASRFKLKRLSFSSQNLVISHVWRVDSTTRKMIEIQQYLPINELLSSYPHPL